MYLPVTCRVGGGHLPHSKLQVQAGGRASKLKEGKKMGVACSEIKDQLQDWLRSNPIQSKYHHLLPDFYNFIILFATVHSCLS